MAKRLTDTDIWDKEWFMNLSPKLKCLVKLVRDKCDLSGVWNPNWILAKIYIGEAVTENDLLSIDSGKQFQKLASGKIFCLDFIQFQNGKLSDKSPIHIKILSLLETHGIPYPYPINRVLDTPIVEVIVKEGVIVKEKVNVKEDKVEIRENVFLTTKEIEKLKLDFGEGYEWAIDTISNYKFSSGKKYKSDYHALIGWVKDKYTQENKKQHGSNSSNQRDKRAAEREALRSGFKKIFGNGTDNEPGTNSTIDTEAVIVNDNKKAG